MLLPTAGLLPLRPAPIEFPVRADALLCSSLDMPVLLLLLLLLPIRSPISSDRHPTLARTLLVVTGVVGATQKSKIQEWPKYGVSGLRVFLMYLCVCAR